MEKYDALVQYLNNVEYCMYMYNIQTLNFCFALLCTSVTLPKPSADHQSSRVVRPAALRTLCSDVRSSIATVQKSRLGQIKYSLSRVVGDNENFMCRRLLF